MYNEKYCGIINSSPLIIKSFFHKALFNQGRIFINDIIDKNRRYIPYQTLINTFGNSLNNFDYICLKDAIPLKWRLLLKHQNTLDMRPNEETIFFTYNKECKPIQLIKSKQIYWILNTQKIEIPTCIKSWFEKYFI